MLTGLLTFLLVIIVLLAIPIALRYQVSWQGALQGEIRLYWAFGLVRLRIPVSAAQSAPSQIEQAPQTHRRKKRSARRKSNPLAAIRQRAFRRRVLRFIREFWCAIQKRDMNLRIRIGLEDPADTGQLWALLGPVAGMLANIRQVSIGIEPEFSASTLELDSSGWIRIVPLQLLYLILALLLSPAIWQGIRRIRRSAS